MSKSNGNDILRKVQQAIILEKTVIIYAPLDFSIVINKYTKQCIGIFSSGLKSSNLMNFKTMALDCFELDLRKLSTKFGIKSELEILQELKFLIHSSKTLKET